MTVYMKNLASHSGDSSTTRYDEMNLFGSFRNRQAVVAHGGLAGEEPAVNSSQNDGRLGAWDADNTMLMSHQFTRLH